MPSRSSRPSAILPAVAPKRSSQRRPSISIVGVGNLGSALAITLSAAGYAVENLVVRTRRKIDSRTKTLARQTGGRIIALGSERLNTDIFWVTVPGVGIPHAVF